MINDSAALVIGFTIQGMAIARALSGCGVPVYALEKGLLPRSIFRSHPVNYTKHARFMSSEKLLGPDLIETLLAHRPSISEKRVVLFPASDNTVRVLAQHWELLENAYLMSWAECRSAVSRVIQKGCLPAFCEAADILYPRTTVVTSTADIVGTIDLIDFPVLVKPNKPASSFKTHICCSPEQLSNFLMLQKSNWPLVVQEWIDGPDDSLYAYTCIMRDQSEVFGMASRKIRSSPPALGRATVIETIEDRRVQEESRRLISKLGVSGPIATEFKRDKDGRLWFIEANVGRTEYCVDLAIQAGFNVPILEFYQALNEDIPEVPNSLTPSIWYDTDKEPFCYWAQCLSAKSLRPFGKKPVFPYWGKESWLVLLVAQLHVVKELLGRLGRKIGKLLSGSDSN